MNYMGWLSEELQWYLDHSNAWSCYTSSFYVRFDIATLQKSISIVSADPILGFDLAAALSGWFTAIYFSGFCHDWAVYAVVRPENKRPEGLLSPKESSPSTDGTQRLSGEDLTESYPKSYFFVCIAHDLIMWTLSSHIAAPLLYILLSVLASPFHLGYTYSVLTNTRPMPISHKFALSKLLILPTVIVALCKILAINTSLAVIKLWRDNYLSASGSLVEAFIGLSALLSFWWLLVIPATTTLTIAEAALFPEDAPILVAIERIDKDITSATSLSQLAKKSWTLTIWSWQRITRRRVRAVAWSLCISALLVLVFTPGPTWAKRLEPFETRINSSSGTMYR